MTRHITRPFQRHPADPEAGEFQCYTAEPNVQIILHQVVPDEK